MVVENAVSQQPQAANNVKKRSGSLRRLLSLGSSRSRRVETAFLSNTSANEPGTPDPPSHNSPVHGDFNEKIYEKVEYAPVASPRRAPSPMDGRNFSPSPVYGQTARKSDNSTYAYLKGPRSPNFEQNDRGDASSPIYGSSVRRQGAISPIRRPDAPSPIARHNAPSPVYAIAKKPGSLAQVHPAPNAIRKPNSPSPVQMSSKRPEINSLYGYVQKPETLYADAVDGQSPQRLKKPETPLYGFTKKIPAGMDPVYSDVVKRRPDQGQTQIRMTVTQRPTSPSNGDPIYSRAGGRSPGGTSSESNSPLPPPHGRAAGANSPMVRLANERPMNSPRIQNSPVGNLKTAGTQSPISAILDQSRERPYSPMLSQSNSPSHRNHAASPIYGRSLTPNNLRSGCVSPTRNSGFTPDTSLVLEERKEQLKRHDWKEAGAGGRPPSGRKYLQTAEPPQRNRPLTRGAYERRERKPAVPVAPRELRRVPIPPEPPRAAQGPGFSLSGIALSPRKPPHDNPTGSAPTSIFARRVFDLDFSAFPAATRVPVRNGAARPNAGLNRRGTESPRD
ncbi:Hypothetical protein NTJ_13317 [Nesidiocoris tenuis]|uniref:Uncharacterized protein n=1 Tax=Nesidiocoris tenuis TaxID=355587 RepID=A0ABN7BA51_9HEMI|nr:Hypothetical protein NTJ_13317 [Nesidiocoris tenuis]